MIEPPVALHVTLGLGSVLPSLIVATALNCFVWPACRLADPGVTSMPVTVGAEGPETVTVLVSAGPAGLLPMTVKTPADAGAV